jgi:GxxExxY protein
MSIDELSYTIRGAIFNVYKSLGPGLLESAYEAALYYELVYLGLEVKRQLQLPLMYRDVQLDVGYRIDLMVNDQYWLK